MSAEFTTESGDLRSSSPSTSDFSPEHRLPSPAVGSHSSSSTTGTAGKILAEYPLSAGQQGLWVMQKLSRESGVNNCIYGARIPTELDIEAFRRAVYKVAGRHPILRTTFTTRDGKPVQRVHELPIAEYFKHYDARAWSDEELQAKLSEEIYCHYDLEHGPLMQIIIFTLSERTHLALLALHHIITDFWSIALYLVDLGAFYTEELTGVPAELKPLTSQYRDFVESQAEMLKGQEGERLWEFWREYLSGELPPLNLPADHPRPPLQTWRGACCSTTFSPEFTARLESVARTYGATPFAISLAAFQVLLHRYTSQEDILVCSPKALRSRSTARVQGYFINPVPIRVSLSGNPIFSEFLRQVRESSLAALEHGQFPYSLLIERLNLPRDPARPLLCQVAFAWQKTTRIVNQEISAFALNEEGGRLELGALTIESFHFKQRIAPLELTLQMAEKDGQIGATIEYNTALFEAATITRMLGHYRTLMESIVADPEQRVAQLPMLTGAEQHQIFAEWNATAAPFSDQYCVHQLVEAQARRTPEAVAVSSAERTLSYRELNERAEQLALFLQKKGVGPNVNVAIGVERSPELIIAALAVLRAGAAYLPLDLSWPQERLAFTLADAGVSILLTQEQFRARLSEPKSGLHLFCLDSDWPLIAEESSVPAISRTQPQDLAYVIYTSGSTGQPKGVEIEHRSLLNLVAWHQQTYGITPQDRATLIAAPGFDASVWELWPYLTAGASLHIPDDETRLSPSRLQKWLIEQQISICFLPTPLAESLLRLPWPRDCALRRLLTGGDRLRHYPAPGLPFELWNNYGPTEYTVVTTCCQVPPREQSEEAPPIGHPISNTQVYVLDAAQQPVPVGVPGELYIGGAGLARGYLNRPELTAEKFIEWSVVSSQWSVVSSQWSVVSGQQSVATDHGQRTTDNRQRLYRTGDLVRWLPDGNLEFLGRLDAQVKIRGSRVELGEIEVTLRQHPFVHDACVVVKEKTAGNKLLAAYLVPRKNGTGPQATHSWQELKDWLSTRLPGCMMPAAFVMMEALPLMPSGKVDRRALSEMPLPILEREAADSGAQTEAERIIAAIWQEVLQVDRVGRHDNFFDLGGHSLLAARVTELIQEALGQEFSIIDLFRYPTVSALAGHLTQSPGQQQELSSALNRAEKQKQALERQRQARSQRGRPTPPKSQA